MVSQIRSRIPVSYLRALRVLRGEKRLYFNHEEHEAHEARVQEGIRHRICENAYLGKWILPPGIRFF